jgi:hypothetical protein
MTSYIHGCVCISSHIYGNFQYFILKYVNVLSLKNLIPLEMYVFMMGNKRVYVIHPQLLNHVFMFLIWPRRSL